jgi:beta-glucosidase
VNRELNSTDAFVAAWLPGSEGAGIADVLFRSPVAGATAYDFNGRLGFSWPRTAMPVNFDSSGKVSGALFATGYGLNYHSKQELARVPENPDVAPHWNAEPGSLFSAGHATAPWLIFAADDSAEVHLTLPRQYSPNSALEVAYEPAEAGLRATWSGNQSGMLRFAGKAADLRGSADRGTRIEMRYRVNRSPEQPVKISMRCTDPLCGVAGGATLDLSSSFTKSTLGEWLTLSIPLACFKSAGADLAHVEVPLAIATSGPFALSISEVRLTPALAAAKPGACPGTATG